MVVAVGGKGGGGAGMVWITISKLLRSGIALYFLYVVLVLVLGFVVELLDSEFGFFIIIVFENGRII